MELKVDNMIIYESGKPADAATIALADGMIGRLNKIDTAILESIKRSGVKINLTEDYVGNIIPGLMTPRGYSTGSTWNTVPGMFSSSRNQVLARIGYTNTDCGTFSLELHETGHAVDYRGLANSNFTDDDVKFFYDINNIPSMYNSGKSKLELKRKKITETAVFKRIFNAEKRGLIPDAAYNSQYFDNIEEYFAETFAMFHSDNSRNKIYETTGIAKSIINCDLGIKSPQVYLEQNAPQTYKFFEDLPKHLNV